MKQRKIKPGMYRNFNGGMYRRRRMKHEFN